MSVRRRPTGWRGGVTMVRYCFLKRLTGRALLPRLKGSRSARTRQHGPELLLEPLEDRCVPSVFVVNDLGDKHAVDLMSGMDAVGTVTLRSAVEAANYQGGDQTIQFDPNVFAIPQTIKLSGALDLKGALITIQGPAAGVTISGNHITDIFRVESMAQADL